MGGLMAKKNDTIARVAGNIASGLVSHPDILARYEYRDGLEGEETVSGRIAGDAVGIARAILAEIDRTEPKPSYAQPATIAEMITEPEQPEEQV